jgi:hypothetical protein
MECPHCHKTEGVTKLRQPFQFTFGLLVLALLGGMIGGLFWGLGQENKYRCEQCQRTFYSHTRVSRVFRVLAIITYVGVAALVVFGIFMIVRH